MVTYRETCENKVRYKEMKGNLSHTVGGPDYYISLFDTFVE